MDTLSERPSPRHERPGSQSALRGQNVRRVVAALMAGGARTQAELARQTGLSRATVSSIVRIMVDTGIATTSPTTSSGRRAVLVRIEGRGAVAAGIDLGRRHVRVVLASLGYDVIAERSTALPAGHPGDVAIAAAGDLLDALLDDHSIDRAAVLGAGAGIPGPIDRRTGTVVDRTVAPQWAEVDAAARLEERLGVPVHIDNDANLGALAEVTWGVHTAAQSLAFLKIGSGVGCGLILAGRPFHGHIGTAGEIGHTSASESGPRCRCGNRGCLEITASTSMMIDTLSRDLPEPLTTEEIVAQALAGDTATVRVVEDAGWAAGRALAGVVNLLNPEVVVVGGPLAGLGEVLLDPVRRGLLRHAMPLAASTTHLAISTLGDRAEALGAAALVLHQPDLPLVLVGA